MKMPGVIGSAAASSEGGREKRNMDADRSLLLPEGARKGDLYRQLLLQAAVAKLLAQSFVGEWLILCNRQRCGRIPLRHKATRPQRPSRAWIVAPSATRARLMGALRTLSTPERPVRPARNIQL